ncbi:uncharacterized protein OCT59_029745 [Rhizophagus irregularis]|uniref:uncharacterized protein n=1 Tax=Rhizophagus irregularis TaxID=588596 RepID=UPI003323B2ED|nr:hypothetical protein OCT59_029745 [Rhizophagus irregularis]
MANLNILNVNINNVLSNWPFDATRALIRYRRLYHNVFEDRSIRDHSIIWARIARRISNNYNFIVTQNQCCNEWRALKRGFENLTRINNGNPDGHPIHSPNNYDIRFFNELSDEFWLQTSYAECTCSREWIDRSIGIGNDAGVIPEAVAAAATAIGEGEKEIEEEEIGIKVNTN